VGRLVIDGNTVYEIDEECERRKKENKASERRKYRENEQKGRPLAAPQSLEMPVRSAAETASISPSAAAAEKENDPDTAVVASRCRIRIHRRYVRIRRSSTGAG